MDRNKPLNEQIAELRKKLGISPSVLASAIGVNPSTITRYENGERGITTDKAAEILRVLNADIQVVDYPIKRPTERRLWTIAKSQIAEDILELQFLADYARLSTRGSRQSLINRYAAGVYEDDSGRPTAMDKGTKEIDEEIVGKEKREKRIRKKRGG